LDKNPGVETLLLVASRQPLENLEGFVAGLEEMASPRTRLKGSGGGVTIRGVGSVTKKKRSGRARRDENAIRTKALTRIQSLARSMDIEIVQSVTYIHMR
jgi:hypothetical protein